MSIRNLPPPISWKPPEGDPAQLCAGTPGHVITSSRTPAAHGRRRTAPRVRGDPTAAKGNLAKFDEVLAGACADWRDTLSAAGLANQNWKLVLDKRGIDCTGWPAGPAGPAG
jgi:hypothetical protein